MKIRQEIKKIWEEQCVAYNEFQETEQEQRWVVLGSKLNAT